jgi:cytochrome c oxidase subunit IV
MAHVNPNPKPVPPQQEVTKHPSAWVYHATFGFLMFMLIVTVVLYYVDLDRKTGITGINLIVALIVASMKATAVVLFFMNVKNGTKLTWLWAALGFIWALLMGGIFMDYESRAWVSHDGWQR